MTSMMAEMGALGCEPTATETELLLVAHELVDRMDRLETVVNHDGELLTSSTGVVRMHPAAVEHRQLSRQEPRQGPSRPCPMGHSRPSSGCRRTSPGWCMMGRPVPPADRHDDCPEPPPELRQCVVEH